MIVLDAIALVIVGAIFYLGYCTGRWVHTR